MRKKLILIASVTMAVLFAVGSAKAAPIDTSASPAEGTSAQKLSIAVKGVGEKSTEIVDSLEVVVTNMLNVPMNVELDLYAYGLIDRIEVRDIGSLELKPGDVKNVIVAAADLPILSANSVTEAYVEAMVLIDHGDWITETTAQSREFYYRHSPDFVQMMTGTARVMSDEMGGMLWGEDAATSKDALDTADDGVLGVAVDDWGNETVVGADEAFVELYQDGQYIGRIVGAGMEIGSGGAVQAPSDTEPSAAATSGSPPMVPLSNPFPKIRFIRDLLSAFSLLQ